ncbi:CdaR family protein [Shimazuella sp. AN120528]|uniref:CdaR family protein n=1 Tax=Shimazuella soli TaxID=1892854 RepID=UPI001F10DD6D|nr:CdaR family protein [Shimazuella soli]MCH5585371.1 CdaR family protein [Shimazuella soli]
MASWFQREWVLRVISLILAAILWFMVSEPTLPISVNRSSTTVRGIEVEYRYNTKKYQVLSEKHKVDLVFTGDKNTINRLPSYRVFVDLRKLSAGRYLALPVSVEGLPANVQVRPNPSTISVEIAEKVTKTIPITIITRGAVADGYKLLPLTYTPTYVSVSGIRQEVEKVTDITALVNVNGLQQTINQDIYLAVHSNTAKKPKVKVMPIQAQVTIPIEKLPVVSPPPQPQVEYGYRDIPIQITVSKPPPEGYKVESITTNPLNIRVYGPVEKLKTLQTYPAGSIDLSQVTEDTTIKQEVKVVSPVEKVTPNWIEIYVKMSRTPS